MHLRPTPYWYPVSMYAPPRPRTRPPPQPCFADLYCVCLARSARRLITSPVVKDTHLFSTGSPGAHSSLRVYSSRPSHPDSYAQVQPAASTSTASPAGAPPQDQGLSGQQQQQQLSAAAFLLRQAEIEEAEELGVGRKVGPNIPALREEAWDGDEPQDRAIRRILEDTYKPLRVKASPNRFS